MITYILFLLASLISAPTGSWSGDLEVMGNKIPLVFHLENDSPTIDSPAQGVKGLPIQLDKTDNGHININIPLINASFEGVYENDLIKGTFKQNGLSLPLILKPGEEKPKRPQTPHPPYPYSEEEVSFSNGDAVLKGTLTLPENSNQETPVIIMVTGSGLQNRDEEIFDHKPFAVIADALAREGIATLRYDDRGFGESTGDAVNCTTEDLKNDALAGIDFLRNRFKRVGILGHSEGGTIALMAGADRKVDFIVSLAGMVISGEETLLNQNQDALNEAGFSKEIVDEYCDLLSLVFENDGSVSEKLKNSNLPYALKQNLLTIIQQVKTPYMQYFINLDMRKHLQEIDCPVLAINGTKDTQVNYKVNLEALNKGLSANKSNTILSYEGLNHMLQHCNSGSITEYSQIEETISPEVLQEIINWIQSLYSIPQ